MARAPSSLIPTAGTSRTRTRDAWEVPLAVRPQAMTLYIRFVELLPTTWTRTQPILQVGASAATTDPRLYLRRLIGTSSYQLVYSNAITSAAVTIDLSPSLHDSIELCGQFSATGTLVLIGSKNGGTLTTSSASSAIAVVTAFAGAVLTIGGTNSVNDSAMAVRNIVVMRGVLGLNAMRQKAGIATI